MENIKFTGVKDVDYLILDKLEDMDLFRFCQINKYAKEILCNDDRYWENRMKKKYSQYIDLQKYKPPDVSWKDYYYWLIRSITGDIKVIIDAIELNKRDVILMLLNTRPEEILNYLIETKIELQVRNKHDNSFRIVIENGQLFTEAVRRVGMNNVVKFKRKLNNEGFEWDQDDPINFIKTALKEDDNILEIKKIEMFEFFGYNNV